MVYSSKNKTQQCCIKTVSALTAVLLHIYICLFPCACGFHQSYSMERINIFLQKKSEKPHTLLLCLMPFSVLPPGLLILAVIVNFFPSNSQCFFGRSGQIFSKLGICLSMWLFAWDSKYFPIRKHYTSVLPTLLVSFL